MRAVKVRALFGIGVLLLLTVVVTVFRTSQVKCVIAKLEWRSTPVWTGGGRRLEPGRPLQAEFQGERPQSSHAYKIRLEAGQSLGVELDQDEVDVSATLWSPKRKILLEVDAPIGGPEHLYFVAPSGGEYGLLVQSQKRGQSGRYRVRLQPPRPATERDRQQAEAVRILALAERYHKEWEDTCAIPLYERARTMLRGLGDLGAVTEITYRLDLIHLQHPEALKSLEQEVLPRWRSTPRESLALNEIGETLVFHDPYRAQSFHRQALVAAHALHRHSEEMRAFIDLINVYRTQGNIQEAFNAFGVARDLARSRRDLSELAGAVSELFLSMGDYRRTLEFSEKSLSLLPDSLADPGLRIVTLRTKGIAEYSLRHYGEALTTLQDALRMARALKRNPGFQAIVLTAMGTAYVDRYEDMTPADPEDLVKARECLEEALKYAKKAGEPYSEGNAISYLGRVSDLEGRDGEGLRRFDEAFDLYSSLGSPTGTAGSLNGRAQVRRSLGQLQEALADIESAIRILENVRSHSESGEIRSSFLSAWRSLFEFEADLLVDLDRQHPHSGYAIRAFETTEELRARSLLEILVENGEVQRTVDPGLKSRIEQVEARLRELNPQLLLPPEADLRPRSETIEAEARDRLVELEVLRAGWGGERAAPVKLAAPLPVAEIQRRILDEDTLILAYLLGEKRGLLWAIDARSVRVYPLRGRREIEEQAEKVANLFARGDLQKRWAEAVSASHKLSDLVLLPVANRLKGKRLIILRDGALYRIPFEALPDPRRPWQVQPGAWPSALNEQNEILYEPSASVLAEISEQSRERPTASKRFAGFGDPVFRPDDERIAGSAGPSLARLHTDPGRGASAPFSGFTRGLGSLVRLEASGREIEKIAALLPESETLKVLGFDARRERVLAPDLADYEILHFATHSLLDSSFPELSSLVFSLSDKEGWPQNGFLSFYEISNLHLPVGMVVLSACRTAVGEESPSEGSIGLGRAFLHAGASRVVMSLWDVDDDATAALMEHFYRAIFERGLSPAAALREARLWVSRQPKWAAPHYWAPFVLEGDWHRLPSFNNLAGTVSQEVEGRRVP